MRNALEKFVGNTILFSGTIKDFKLTDPDINMDNNIIDNTIKYTNSPISYNYKPQGIHIIRYNSYRTLLTNVTVSAVVGINEYISFNLDHIWIIYDLRIKGYNLNDYISNFYGQVMKYRRKNGSIDYGIYFI